MRHVRFHGVLRGFVRVVRPQSKHSRNYSNSLFPERLRPLPFVLECRPSRGPLIPDTIHNTSGFTSLESTGHHVGAFALDITPVVSAGPILSLFDFVAIRTNVFQTSSDAGQTQPPVIISTIRPPPSHFPELLAESQVLKQQVAARAKNRG